MDPDDAWMEAMDMAPSRCPQCGCLEERTQHGDELCECERCPHCGEIWPEGELECAHCDTYKTNRCNLCSRPIPEQIGAALCSSCERTCRAHARLEQAHREWVADGRPD